MTSAVIIFGASLLSCEIDSSSVNDGEISAERALYTAEGDPIDDPQPWPVDPSIEYTPHLGETRWVIPSGALPDEARADISNNNVDIELFEGRLFLAWRTGPTHFASTQTRIVVISSLDLGETWSFETEIEMGVDIREPCFLVMDGALQLMFFEGGTNMIAFEPKRVLRRWRGADGIWGEIETFIEGPEVPWDLKVRYGRAYLTTYRGAHYDASVDPDTRIEVYLKTSEDGRSWTLQDDALPFVYRGGVSEAAFEFDRAGNLWAVTRNEDGDSSGRGAHVCFAPADHLSQWSCSMPALPDRYDSPEMFRHGDELYLLARRDPEGVFGEDDGLIAYSLRSKRTALYKIDQEAHSIEWIMDLPGCGDTAFPTVRRLDAHTFLIANYTSPLDDLTIPWLTAQVSDKGTQIYLTTLTFIPQDAP